jgi:hypothetical protein
MFGYESEHSLRVTKRVKNPKLLETIQEENSMVEMSRIDENMDETK